MIFEILKYNRAIWYFNLKPKVDFCYFPTLEQIEKQGFKLKIDQKYKTVEAQNRDLAYRAFQLGFISNTKEKGLDIWQKTKIPATDEYRFLRKNLHPAWVLYTLSLRIITFHNPISEVLGFLNSGNIKRENYSKNIFEYTNYDAFDSTLIKQNPLISVIIPTLNRYQYLKDVMRDLEQQSYKNFEVIIVDQTDDYQKDFYKNWTVNLKHWHQEEKALWKARNEAIQAAKGDYILLYDDDSLVANDWIYEHLKALDFFDADLSSGVSISTHGDKIPEHYSYFRWSDQLDTGNVLIKKSIFKNIGLFDRQFEKQRMGDGEFGLRSYLAGYKNISNYKAKRIHLKVSEGGLRQMGSWDGWRPKKLFGPRPVPSVLYISRKYFGVKFTLLFIIQSILPSLIPYKFKANKVLKVLSFLFIPIVFPLICIQVYKSWQLSSVKLKQGSKINQL
jgi:glycosyltransferase involved in cell wall biosynthesis